MRKKSEVITFKVDDALARAMRGVRNRSEFIRDAVMSALDNSCPLCGGTGILSAHQREHMQKFLASHKLEECDDCHGAHLICEKNSKGMTS